MEDTTRAKIENLIKEMEAYRGGTTSDTFQRPIMARIQLMLADEQSKSAQILECYTRQLVILNRTLVWLTVALLVFTVGFAVFH